MAGDLHKVIHHWRKRINVPLQLALQDLTSILMNYNVYFVGVFDDCLTGLKKDDFSSCPSVIKLAANIAARVQD